MGVSDDVIIPSLLQLTHSSYLAEGFLHLQNVIGQAIIENKTGQTLNLDVTVEVKLKEIVNDKLIVTSFSLYFSNFPSQTTRRMYFLQQLV